MKKFAPVALALAVIAAFGAAPASARTVHHHAAAQSSRELYMAAPGYAYGPGAAAYDAVPAPSNGVEHYPDFAVDVKSGSAENRAELGY
jgi:hypothetical protein